MMAGIGAVTYIVSQCLDSLMYVVDRESIEKQPWKKLCSLQNNVVSLILLFIAVFE